MIKFAPLEYCSPIFPIFTSSQGFALLSADLSHYWLIIEDTLGWSIKLSSYELEMEDNV